MTDTLATTQEAEAPPPPLISDELRRLADLLDGVRGNLGDSFSIFLDRPTDAESLQIILGRLRRPTARVHLLKERTRAVMRFPTDDGDFPPRLAVHFDADLLGPVDNIDIEEGHAFTWVPTRQILDRCQIEGAF